MAFDIYAGTLSRYYLGDWENEAQHSARQNGLDYNVIRPNEENDEKDVISKLEMIEIIKDWLQFISPALGVNLEFLENLDHEYFTKRINNFDNFYLLNCLIHLSDKDLINLNELSDSLKLKQVEIIAKKNSEFIYFGQIEAWFPVELPGSGIYEFEFPNNKDILFSSVSKMMQELDLMEQKLINYRANLIEFIGLDDLLLLNEDIKNMRDTAEFSIKNKVPIILDY